MGHTKKILKKQWGMKQNNFTSILAEFDSSFICRFQISQEYNPPENSNYPIYFDKSNWQCHVCFVAKISGSQPLVFSDQQNRGSTILPNEDIHFWYPYTLN